MVVRSSRRPTERLWVARPAQDRSPEAGAVTGRFEGSTAVVTEGTSGIGRAIAVSLGEEGARVYVAGRDEERGAAVAREVTSRGGQGQFVRVDVAVDAEVGLLATTAAAAGPIDHWFSNAEGRWGR
jgi:NAD(P)-dependent dehydrogenase (short-subunit alcohol dehydrogenase family)